MSKINTPFIDELPFGNAIIQGKQPRIVFANSILANILGYSLEELLSAPYSDCMTHFIHEDKDAFLMCYQDHINGEIQDSTRGEFRAVRKDGLTLWFDIFAYRVEHNGKPAMRTLFIDITERRLREKTLKESEERLQAIVNNIPFGIVIIDAESHMIIDANHTAIEMIGEPKEKTIGSICHKYICVAEKGRCPITDCGMTIHKTDCELLAANNRTVPIVKSVIKININGRDCLAEGFIDITERLKAEETRKESEKKYRLISENTSDLIAMVGLDGKYTYISPSHKRLGFDPEELIGKTGLDFVHPDDKELVASIIKGSTRTLTNQSESKSMSEGLSQKYRVCNKSGEWRNLESTIDMIINNSGKIIAFLLVSRDITELVQTEEELNKSIKIMDMMIDGITIIDMQGRITYINKALIKHTGYTKDEIIGKIPVEIILPKTEWPKFYQELKFIQANDIIEDSIYLVRRKNGSEFLASFNLSILKDSNNSPSGVIAVLRDITEKKQAEEALLKAHDELEQRVEERTNKLRKANKKLNQEISERRQAMEALIKEQSLSESMINSLPGVFYLFDENGKFIRWNKYLENISEYSSEEVAKLNVFDFFEGDNKRIIEEAINEVFNNNEFSIEAFAITKSGRRIPFIFSGLKTIIDNKVHLVGLGIDISELKRMEQALKQSDEHYRHAIESTPNPFFSVDIDGIIQIWNKACNKIFQYGTEIIGQKYYKLLSNPEDKSLIETMLAQVFAGGSLSDIDVSYQRRDGSELFMVSRLFPMFDHENNITGCVLANTDITERKRAEKALQDSQRMYRNLVESLPDGIFEIDVMGNFTFVNRTAFDTFGYSQKDLDDGLNPLRVITPEDRERAITDIEKIMNGEELELSEYTALKKNGSAFPIILHIKAIPDDKGNVIGARGIIVDITEKKRAEDQLLHNAFHDGLTGLPNRALFLNRLGQSIKILERNKDHFFAVLFLDLDRFKIINDSLGHMTGDMLLIEASKTLVSSLRPMDTIARLGGDEFAILLTEIKDHAEIKHIVERIQKILSIPISIKGHDVVSTTSIGIATSANEYNYPEDLLRDAETAMYRAKKLGRARYEAFDKEMRKQVTNQLQMETDLRHAIERNEFRLFYQPIISLKSGRISGFETLLRWEHPKRGLVYPMDFIPILEETELILQISKWILYEASRQMAEWQKKFQPKQALYVTVNLSALQFRQPDLLEQIKHILQNTSLSPRCLTLEITESVIMENYETTSSLLLQLRDMNVRLAIDDFGTGYSSLSYLHNFPISILKIDHSFISQMSKNGGKFEIVKTIVNMAHNLGMRVVAEGIETEAQLAMLRDLKCEYGQGYLFSKPVDSKAAEILIKNDPIW